MTDRDGEKVQHYNYTAFGSSQYTNSATAFSVTNRYTGQQIDEETGLYFYQSRYYDAKLARFTQADTVVPSSQTSLALNRYTYVRNNPLKFTDPSGHGWFSKLWKKIKGWVGTIVTVALMGTPLAPFAPLIGAAIGAAINGGTFKSFAIGVGIGMAAGAIGGYFNAGPLADGAGGIFNNLGGFTEIAQGAFAGMSGGAISSVVYGQNVAKGLGSGAIAGLTGYAVSAVTSAAVSYGGSVARELAVTAGHSVPKSLFGELAQGISQVLSGIFGGIKFLVQQVLQLFSFQQSPWKQQYATQHEAAIAALKNVNPRSISENREYGGLIEQRNGMFTPTKPIRGTLDSLSYLQKLQIQKLITTHTVLMIVDIRMKSFHHKI